MKYIRLKDKLLKFKNLRITAFTLLALTAQAGAAEAIADCGEFVREQRALAIQENIEMTRQQGMTLLAQCENGEMALIVAAQKQVLAELNAEIEEIGLKIDSNNQIIDDQGRRLAQIVAINGQLIIRRQQVHAETAALNADSEAQLLHVEQTLQRLVTQ